MRFLEWPWSAIDSNYRRISQDFADLAVSERVKCSRLKFFGHLARSAQEEDQYITVSSPPHCDRHLTGGRGDPWGVQEQPGWERSTMTFSLRTLESTRRVGRQGGLTTSRHYDNALLGLKYMYANKKKKKAGNNCRTNEDRPVLSATAL